MELLERGAAQRIGRDRFQLQRVEPHAVVGDAVVEMRAGGEPGHADVADHVALHDLLAGTDALGETREVEVRRLDARAVADADEVPLAAVVGGAEDEMRAGGEPGHADVADHVALHDLLAGTDALGETREVEVRRLDARAVADADEVPLAAFVVRLEDNTVRRGHDGRAGGRAVVDAVVRSEGLQDRMKAALREVRRDAGELQRRAEELLAQRAAVARVVAGAAVRRFLAVGLVSLAAVREARGDDGAVAEEAAAAEALADDEAERVAATQGEEVDVPLEDVDELLDELRPFAGESQRLVQRGVDLRGDGGLDFLHLHFAVRDIEAARVIAHGVELAPADDLHLYAVDRAVGSVMKTDDVAGAEAAEVDGLAELAIQHAALGAREAAGDEDGVEGVALFEGEEDGVLRKDIGRGGGELIVAEALRRRGGEHRGAARVLRGTGGGW